MMTRSYCLRLMLVSAAVAVLGCGAASAQGAKPATADVPRGPGSLSGVWVNRGDPSGTVKPDEALYSRKSVLTTADGSPLPALPWAMQIVEKRLKDAADGHPYASIQARCLPPGVPDMMYEYGPMQFLETPGQVTILRQEYTFFRVIHLNRGHVADPDPSYLGDSIGHWEGDTLVVDTIGLKTETGIKFIIPHSEALHIVERFRRTGPASLEWRATLDDPKTFSKPWDMVTEFKSLPVQLTEYFCENNRNGTDANGNETVQAKAVGH